MVVMSAVVAACGACQPRPKVARVVLGVLAGFGRFWAIFGVFWLILAMLSLAQAQFVLKPRSVEPRAEFVQTPLGDSAQTAAVAVRLALYAPAGTGAGQTVWLGVVFDHSPHWHTYWTNPGEAGLPTELQWSLPEGWRLASTAAFEPAPHTVATAGMVSYAHEGRAVLLTPVHVERAAPQGAHVGLDARWLACQSECIPEQAQLTLTLADWQDDADNAAMFARAAAAVPQPLPSARAVLSAGQNAQDGHETMQLSLNDLPAAWQGRALQVWPEQANAFVPALPLAADQRWQGAHWSATLALAAAREAAPQTLAFVVAPLGQHEQPVTGTDGVAAPPARAWRVVASVADAAAWGEVAQPAELPAALAAALGREGAAQATSAQNGTLTARGLGADGGHYAALRQLAGRNLGAADDFGAGGDFVALADWQKQSNIQSENQNTANLNNSDNAENSLSLSAWILILAGAFVGGAILNLMPCVFPVLAIKVVAFATHGANVRVQRRAALAYTGGVVLSFVALGAAMVALRAAGAQVGWGFQLQNPVVVLAMGTLFVLIALNLLGVFEFGQMLPQSWAGWRGASEYGDAFGSGVLAVLVAAPCTAPFMGASLGAAAVLPAAAALAVFVALGLGMSAPYVALAWWPAVARALPRPGAWMQMFKHAMAFPMLAAAIWLAWVLGQLAGVDAMAQALLVWLALAACVGAAARLTAGAWRWALWAASAAALVWLAQGLGTAAQMANVAQTQTQPSGAAQSGAGSQTSQGPNWQPWTAQAQAQALAAGRTVFVDYTAAWCITCQFNKRRVLGQGELGAAFEAAGVVALRADWTARDAAITAELARLGRAGVPTYVVLRPDAAPVLLGELPTLAEITQALAAQ